MTLIEPGLRLGVTVGLLAALAAGSSAAAGLGLGPAVLRALGRAAVQLTAVSLVIAALLGSLAASFAFVALMFAVAAYTAARRITRARSGLWAGLAVAAGAAPVIALVLATGVVPVRGAAVVPISGIVIGGTMTATAVGARRALDELTARHGEYEAALSIGLTEREAGLELCRSVVTLGVVPALDQTRTVGLVALPGAFVGVLLGGGSATEAGAAQILVLAGLLAAETVAVAVALELVVRHRLVPAVPRAVDA